MDWTNIFIAIVASGVLNLITTYLLNRRQTEVAIAAADASTSVTLADAASKIMQTTLQSTFDLNGRVGELSNGNEQLTSEVQELRRHMKTQSGAIEELKAEAEQQRQIITELRDELTRIKMAMTINILFIERLGKTPPVTLADLETLPTEALSDIVESMSNEEPTGVESEASDD